MENTGTAVIRQHLIDPEICIRCNTCEEACPIDAITHDSNNYVVKPDVCNGCEACVPPCPTGAIDNWRMMLKQEAYPIEDQFGWDELPEQVALPEGAEDAAAENDDDAELAEPAPSTAAGLSVNSVVPPWSAAHPYTNLYGHKAPLTATVAGNYRLTDPSTSSDIHHIVLDFGTVPFPVLEGQSLGIIPPGTDARGKAHHARQYSIASPRDGERRGYNNVSLTVKRVEEDHQGNPANGVCSNYLCDLKKGDTVQVTGPFGHTFLMANHPGAHLVMICTGTGSAPMRAMTEYRRRHRQHSGGGKLLLFFGARTKEELPYFGPLMTLPKDFIDTNLAFSRTPGQPKRYVQDLMRERAADLLEMLRDDNAYFYVCGLKSMEEGVLNVFRDVVQDAGLNWDDIAATLKKSGRLHLETY
ncbi:MAG: benzoyl-CoA 2,3-epoxidase subunit BoxA [Pigmentiphaga sp.]|nr:benzoyl-CoA 2,3-epoxidase subunit BoxA [Pigmentiphaga sp.]